MVTMSKRLAILMIGALLFGTDARAQSAGDRAQSAGDALGEILAGSEFSGGAGALSKNSSAVLYQLFLGETTTFPIGSSAGGFTWIFDSSLLVPVRRSRSFGPMFAERPFTTGKGSLSVGVSFQHTRFESVAGQSLADLE